MLKTVSKLVVVPSLLVALLAGCGQSSGTQSTATPPSSSASKGEQSITVVYPYNPPPQKLLDQFTAETGIKVNWTVLGWDEGYTKIASSQSANTYLGDLVNVDWSRVGQYSQADWFIPLNKYFDVKQLSADIPQLNAFTINGNLVGMPIDGSLMITTINKDDFAKAGITKMPTTMDEYTADLKLLQSKGVNAHPLGIPLAAAESLSTYWYTVSSAFGGSVLGAKYAPQFTDPSSAGYKAMKWIVDAYQTGLVPQSDINMIDTQLQSSQMAQHTVSSILSDYSGNVANLYNLKDKSKVADQIDYIPLPGISGVGKNVGNPDGMGIPKTAKNPEAAAKFLEWFISKDMQENFTGANGAENAIASFPLPTRISAMQSMTANDQVTKASQMIPLFQNNSTPAFPESGPPPWYPQFSNAVYSNIHSAALGQETVDQAVQAIADTLKQLNK
jgi:multiple sugar transport system substrate-binding protein